MNRIKDLQMKFTDILKAKKELVAIDRAALKRWETGMSSPSLVTIDEVCENNNIECFFFDGKIESLIEFNKKIGDQMGFKMQIIFEG